MTDSPFSLLRELYAEQYAKLHVWLAENPNADQSPDYQAELSRWKRLGAAIRHAEEAMP